MFIRSDEQTYSYILNNLTQSSFIRVEKHDAETGKLFLQRESVFRYETCLQEKLFLRQCIIRRLLPSTHFYQCRGLADAPCELSYGQYELIEQETCFGYVLDSEPVPFTVDGTQDVVVVEKHNMPQKGIIHITKTGEVLPQLQKQTVWIRMAQRSCTSQSMKSADLRSNL